MTTHPVTGRVFNERRLDVGARFECVWTARDELAADRQGMDVRHGPGNDREAVRLHPVDVRSRTEQSVRVGMKRLVEERVDGRDLLNLAAVHDGDTVACFG